jgi:acetyl/propionyl-CoA carboxylase alpha subunit
VRNTLQFGKFVLTHPDFVSGKFDTNFVGKNFSAEKLINYDKKEAEAAAIFASYFYENRSKQSTAKTACQKSTSNWVKNRI